jgi:hypothetical protein
MKIRQRMTRILIAALLILPGFAHADVVVVYPALDIQNIGPASGGTDTGASLTTTAFNIDASVIGIATDGNGGFVDITHQDFSLTSSVVTYDATSDIGTFSGSFAVGGGSLLSGSFTNLSVIGLGTGYAQFNGTVTYSGGTLQGSFTTGAIVGGITGGTNVIAKLGTVVPVPAAVWLFGSGLIGFIAVARRKLI